MKIVCISDTHGKVFPKYLPEGDVLIHAGDLSMAGTIVEIQETLHWFRRQPHKHKMFIGGNHDKNLELFPTIFTDMLSARHDTPPPQYLRDKMIEIEGVKFYGSPVTRAYGRIRAFAKSDFDLEYHWKRVPDTDVLITHGPPAGILDNVVTIFEDGKVKDESLGDEDLFARVVRMQPKLHVFGHIHSGHGVKQIAQTTFVNASLLDEQYLPVYEPIVIEL